MVNRPWCCLLVLLFQFHGSEEAKYWFRPHQQAGLSAPPEDRHGSDGHHVLWRQPDVKPSASARHVLAHSPPYQRGNSKPTAFIQSTGKRKEDAPTASVIRLDGESRVGYYLPDGGIANRFAESDIGIQDGQYQKDDRHTVGHLWSIPLHPVRLWERKSPSALGDKENKRGQEE